MLKSITVSGDESGFGTVAKGRSWKITAVYLFSDIHLPDLEELGRSCIMPN